MSESHPVSFDEAAQALEVSVLGYQFAHHPDEQCRRLSERIKLTAKLLAKALGLQQSQALEVLAQALRFSSWHALSGHLSRSAGAAAQTLPQHWLDALSAALILMVMAEDDVAMPPAQLAAFERLGQTLAMLTDAPKQVVLDAVCAHLCGARTWAEVCSRHPLRTRSALYIFITLPLEGDDAEQGGYFVESPACSQLIQELDDRREDYDQMSKPERRRLRRWVEEALAAQPGFLEGGLSLAWMQHEAGEPEAAATVNRFIRQAEALIPRGYKGPIAWSCLANRFYHRLLWLRLKLHHEAGDLASAAKWARKQLRLNPNDNLGVRYVLPLILLAQGDGVAAKRSAARRLTGEHGLTAAAVRAFCEHATGHPAGFRQELAEALISLPWLRKFLLNQTAPLPDGDDGFRVMHPDLETFTDFGWPAYLAVPGLRKACKSFLSEPLVLQAEDELRRYWKGYWGRRDQGRVGSHEGWQALVSSWTSRLAQVP